MHPPECRPLRPFGPLAAVTEIDAVERDAHVQAHDVITNAYRVLPATNAVSTRYDAFETALDAVAAATTAPTRRAALESGRDAVTACYGIELIPGRPSPFGAWPMLHERSALPEIPRTDSFIALLDALPQNSGDLSVDAILVPTTDHEGRPIATPPPASSNPPVR